MAAIEFDKSELFVMEVALDTYMAVVRTHKDWSAAEKAAAIATAESAKGKVKNG
jgi:hypothetical protein